MKALLVPALLLWAAFSGSADAAKGDIGSYTAPGQEAWTRSYWIEGDLGAILIGAQLRPTGAEALLRETEAKTGKRPVMALVLAPTPGQSNGVPALKQRGVMVYSSEQIAERLPYTESTARRALNRLLKDDVEQSAPVSLGKHSRQMNIDGVPFEVHVLGSGVADAHVAVEYEGNLFAGDLVMGPAHPRLFGGELPAWFERLQELRALKPKMVHPAYGVPGGPALISNQMIYIKQLMTLIGAENPRRPPSKEDVARVRSKMMELYPDYAFAGNLQQTVAAEWERQAKNGIVTLGTSNNEE
jgi:hypothetical protein